MTSSARAPSLRRWLTIVLALLLVALSSCGMPSGSSGDPVETTASALSGVTLKSIAVTPPNSTLYAGGTVHLAATGKYSDGSTADVTTAATWTSSDTLVSTVA